MAAFVLMDGVRPREQEVASGDEGPFVIPDLVLGLGPDPAGLMEHPEHHLPDRLGPAINPEQGPAPSRGTAPAHPRDLVYLRDSDVPGVDGATIRRQLCRAQE